MKIMNKYLFRSDDGERFTLQSSNCYTMDNSGMGLKYEYSYEKLISCGFVDSLDKCKIIEYKSNNHGHGDD